MTVASHIYMRHKTITRLFTLLGVSPEIAAEDACKVEHDLNEETFRKILEFVQNSEQS
jgi:DtxR family Mn-dependent transcriptional regulator